MSLSFPSNMTSIARAAEGLSMVAIQWAYKSQVEPQDAIDDTNLNLLYDAQLSDAEELQESRADES